MSEIPVIITVDTEGDNQWARPREITTHNAEYLPRFQALCERYGFKPVYLTNYEMALSDTFCDLAEDVLMRDAGEIGMHLHAWNSPPLASLTADDLEHHPYLIEFDECVMRDKVARLTDLLEQRFSRKMLSHRAGRWGFDNRYASILVEHGYCVDCSVTPGVDWRAQRGNPAGPGGPDYRAFPRRPYFCDPRDISRPEENGALLEVPMTVRPGALYRRAPWLYRVPLLRRAANRAEPGLPWLCPIQPMLRTSLERHLQVMLGLARKARSERTEQHLELMLHSSELMPGGSPDFRTTGDIESLYEYLEATFDELSPWCRGLTLAEFHAHFRDEAAGAPQSQSSAAAGAGTGTSATVLTD